MALSDVQIFDQGSFGYPGSEPFAVAPSAILINAGEPTIINGLGTAGTSVGALTSLKPLVGTDWMVGIAATTSTNTASAAGTVQVTKLLPGTTYLCAPLVATDWNTQTLYNAKVGSRVLFNLTGSSYKITSTDSGSIAGGYNGLTVEPLNITEVPGKVRFSVNNLVSYQNSSVVGLS